MRSLQKAPGPRSTDPARWAVPYRIMALEKMLRSQSIPAGAAISIEAILLPLEEEARLFPKFTLDPYYVHARNRERSFSISGVSEWGVFWYRVDEGLPQHPGQEAMFWGTVDRLSSIAEFVAGRL